MRTEFLFITVLGGIFIAPGARAQVDYAAPGPEAFTTTDFANGTAGSLGGKLVVPNRAGKFPLLVNTHGFSGNAAQQIGWGEHFASYGFVAVVPSMPGGLPPNHQGNGDVIRALALLFSDPSYASPAQGKVDAERIGLSGHSAGGLQTTFAAALIKPRATVLFDPVDYQMTGRPVYATLCSPVMAIFAEPGSCNTQADWSTFKTTSIGPQILLDVIGSNHCDPINPAMAGCDLLCGGVSSAQNQANYSRRATAYFLAMLKDDLAAAATLSASALSADIALRNTAVRDAPNCAVRPADGGVDASTDRAPPPDVATPPDVAAPPDASSPDSAMRDTSSMFDAPLDTDGLDGRNEVGVDAPAMDASREAAVDMATPRAEPPASDASSSADATVAPPTKDGGGSGTTGNNETASSGCDCTLALRRHGPGAGWASALLLGFAAIGRLRWRGRRPMRRATQRP
jgi:dienelactone hydrolase